MKNVSVYAIVYNEEKRIENFIKSFLWSDDIVISIRAGTYDKTLELAKNYPVKTIHNPYNNIQEEGSLEFERGVVDSLKNEWIMVVTASDIIHPRIVQEIMDLINRENFDYDVIKGPGCRYVLGMNNKHSLWFAGYNNWPIAYKKSSLELTSRVHEEKNISSDKVYTVQFAKDEQHQGFLHLTHQTVESAIERTLRYCRTGEIYKYVDEKVAFRQSLKDIIKGYVKIFFINRTWLLGWDGIAIICSYLTYFMLKYLYIWDKFRGPNDNAYEDIMNDVLQAWESEKRGNENICCDK